MDDNRIEPIEILANSFTFARLRNMKDAHFLRPLDRGNLLAEKPYIFLATSAEISGVCIPSFITATVPFSRISWANRLVAPIAALRNPEP